MAFEVTERLVKTLSPEHTSEHLGLAEECAGFQKA